MGVIVVGGDYDWVWWDLIVIDCGHCSGVWVFVWGMGWGGGDWLW